MDNSGIRDCCISMVLVAQLKFCFNVNMSKEPAHLKQYDALNQRDKDTVSRHVKLMQFLLPADNAYYNIPRAIT